MDNQIELITRQPRIGLYFGSFNPFHKGHDDIMRKASKIFDKVILVRGVNPDKKGNDISPLPEYVYENYDVMENSEMIPDFIKSLKYDNITIIRGLRNSFDLQFELNQYRWLQDLMPEIQIACLFSDKEVEHVSSSGIRTLQYFGKDVSNYLP